jgi:hypothetical protein
MNRSHRASPFWRAYTALAQRVDHVVGWDRLPTPLGLLTLIGLRTKLRQQNLADTTALPAVDVPAVGPPHPRYITSRTPDGSYNDL